MTNQVNEFDDTVGAAFEPNPQVAEMPLAGMEITTDDSSDGSIAIGNPVAQGRDPSSISVYAASINPCTYGQGESAIAAFDVVFTVGCIDPDGRSTTYQVVKRIGVDKMKLMNDAMATTPVSIVEAKAPEKTMMSGVSTSRFKALAGLK